MKEKVIYEFEQFCVDPQERLLTRDGKALKLTWKEFTALLVLVEANGRLVAKRELIEKVWPDVHIDEHNLRVTISRVRDVLGQRKNKSPYIQTVPQEGYRFVVPVQIKVQEFEIAEPSVSAKASEVVNASPIDKNKDDRDVDSANGVIEEQQQGSLTPAPAAAGPECEDEKPPIRPFGLKRLLLVFTGCVLLGSVGILVARWHSPAEMHSSNLHQLTVDGRSKGSVLRTDGTTLYFNETDGARQILVSAPVAGSPIREIDTPFAIVFLQDLSNESKTLLVTSMDGPAREGPLWTIPAQGGSPIRKGDVLCSVARWSPDNRKIACANRTKITVMDADGSNSRSIGSFALPVVQLAWTPDGGRLRVALSDAAANRSSAWEIAANKDRTEAQHELLPGFGCCGDWTWVHGGKTSVYSRFDPDGKAHLMMSPEDGLSTGLHAGELPVNIGTLMAFASAKTDNELYLMIGSAYRGGLWEHDAERGWQPFRPGLSAEFIAFSKDGQWITFVDILDRSLWRSRADGTELLQLTKPPMQVEVSSWSPDGRRIAFMGREHNSPYRIRLVSRDGGPIEEAAEGSDNQGGPSWSPDGKEIVYANVYGEDTQTAWVRRIDLATRNAQIVPKSHNFRTARWSPDGKFIAALQPMTGHLMLFDVGTQLWRLLATSVTGDNINWSSDSQSIYADSPRVEGRVVERVSIGDGNRTTVVDLASFQKMPGQLSNWIGLTPDGSPIVCQISISSEVYEMKWTER